MTKKVLVAEDSPTVQKVITLTLENEPFQIVYCENEKSLFSNLDKGHFDMVALDMNLSEKKSGYDLVHEIKLKYPKVSVLALFGTFDAIDEKSFKNSGADEKVIKPFDSMEFVSKCKKLANVSEKVIEKEPEIVTAAETPMEEWTLEAPIAAGAGKTEEAVSDFESWGMDLPGIIEGAQISNESLLEDGAKLLSTMSHVQDLDNEPLEATSSLDDKNLEIPEMLGKTISTDYLNAKELVPEELAEEEKLPPSLNLEAEVNEDISPEDFWAVDEGEPQELIEKVTKKAIEKVAPAYKGDQELINELKESLRPFIEEQVRKYCEKMAEKVAWEVIPDLAENLIKKEIKEISKSLD